MVSKYQSFINSPPPFYLFFIYLVSWLKNCNMIRTIRCSATLSGYKNGFLFVPLILLEPELVALWPLVLQGSTLHPWKHSNWRTEAQCFFLTLSFPFSPFPSLLIQLNPDVHIRLFFDITQDPDWGLIFHLIWTEL